MRVYLHKLGCPKNDVDADYIAARLLRDGHELVGDPATAETIVVNTCCFILPAREESIEEILTLAQLKKNGRLRRLYVAGCLAQHYGDHVLEGMPEVDGAFGLGELDAIAEAVSGQKRVETVVRTEAYRLDYLAGSERAVTDDLPYAYLKISDGCNRGCTFCVIPQIRGRFRSRPMSTILDEAQSLATRGKKELILVSQDTTLYGHDLKDNGRLIDLLRSLDEIDEVRWIRPMYLHPVQVSDELIEHLTTSSNKSLEYFDLPLQHINSRLLKAMGRPTDRQTIEKLVKAIRTASADAVIRGTFIVGFPGETDEEFEELVDFVATWELDRAAGFAYSPEVGSPAADLPDHVSEEVKNDRLDRLMSTQREIAFEKNSALIGATREVIIDSVGPDGSMVGRTRGDCPEIDQEVFVSGAGLTVGQIIRVRIEAADGYDLRATTVED